MSRIAGRSAELLGRRSKGLAGMGLGVYNAGFPTLAGPSLAAPAGRAPARGSTRKSLKDSSIMVVIRLARGGAKKRPFYNIVVADSRERRDGRFIERVGFYNPMAAGGEQPLRVAVDRVSYWTSVGAKLSPTVTRLVGQAKAAA
jgi:small subunit ribosomal protein S16